MFLWLGLSLNPQWVQAVFGAASLIQVDTDSSTIPVLDNSLNKKIRDIIANVQSERRYCMRVNRIYFLNYSTVLYKTIKLIFHKFIVVGHYPLSRKNGNGNAAVFSRRQRSRWKSQLCRLFMSNA